MWNYNYLFFLLIVLSGCTFTKDTFKTKNFEGQITYSLKYSRSDDMTVTDLPEDVTREVFYYKDGDICIKQYSSSNDYLGKILVINDSHKSYQIDAVSDTAWVFNSYEPRYSHCDVKQIGSSEILGQECDVVLFSSSTIEEDGYEFMSYFTYHISPDMGRIYTLNPDSTDECTYQFNIDYPNIALKIVADWGEFTRTREAVTIKKMKVDDSIFKLDDSKIYVDWVDPY